jgi:hypothetical protein
MNLADYFTKHHPPAHHVNVRAEFLRKIKDLADARAARQTTNASDKIAMLQGCVRQASLRELAQRVLAKREILISPKRFVKRQTLAFTHN